MSIIKTSPVKKYGTISKDCLTLHHLQKFRLKVLGSISFEAEEICRKNAFYS